MEEVPTLQLEEELPEGQKRSKVAIGLLVLVLLMLPVGVFMTLRTNNDVRSNAAQPQQEYNTTPDVSMQLISPQTSVNNQAVFPVDVIIRSDQDTINFVSTRINFPPDKLEVISIATSPVNLNDQTKDYFATEWLDSSFSNESGVVNLAAGTPLGLKTVNLPEQKKSVLATIYFKTRTPGDADITLQPGSMMLKEDGQQDLQFTSKSLKTQISDSIGDFANKDYETQALSLAKPQVATTEANLVLESPNGGEVFSFSKPINIKWQLTQPETKTTKPTARNNSIQSKDKIVISLLMNNQFLGQLTETPLTQSEFTWDPAKTLSPNYVKSENNFKIELQSVINGQKHHVESKGPFSILSGEITARQVPRAELTPDRTDLTGDGSVDFKDASYMLTQYLKPVTINNKKSDINNDLQINSIDLWYLKQAIKP